MSTKIQTTSDTGPAGPEERGLVLIVEDQAAFALILRKRIELHGYKVIVATNGEEGLAMAREHHPDVILSDWMMPKMTGDQMCAAIRQCQELEGTYIIMLSNKADSEERVRGFDQGADDYILKHDSHGDLLPARIGAGMRIRRLQKELMRRAQIDGMTELFNRSYFFTRIEEELRRSARYGHKTTLCMIDLNNFKQVNDKQGHLAGDAAIKYVADILRNTCRETDVVARYGGDEFAILFIESDRDAAAQVMERIEKHLAQEPFEYDGLFLSIELSYGLAEADPHAIPHPDSLVAEADSFLYEMKKAKKAALSD